MFDSVPIPVQKAPAMIPNNLCNFTVLKCKLGTAGCRTEYVWRASSISSFEPSSGHQLSYITVVHVKENQEWLRCQNHLAMEIFTCLFHSSPTSFKDSQGHSPRVQLHVLPPLLTLKIEACGWHWMLRFNLTHTAFSVIIWIQKIMFWLWQVTSTSLKPHI